MNGQNAEITLRMRIAYSLYRLYKNRFPELMFGNMQMFDPKENDLLFAMPMGFIYENTDYEISDGEY